MAAGISIINRFSVPACPRGHSFASGIQVTLPRGRRSGNKASGIGQSPLDFKDPLTLVGASVGRSWPAPGPLGTRLVVAPGVLSHDFCAPHCFRCDRTLGVHGSLADPLASLRAARVQALREVTDMPMHSAGTSNFKGLSRKPPTCVPGESCAGNVT